MASTISAGTTSGTAIAISGDTSGELQLRTNGTTTAMTINTAQGVQVLNTIGVGNATPSTSGAGITFPATQSASTDANTLDDYEEGTFTPTFTNFNVGNGTRYGHYIKVGRQVTVNFGFVFGSTSSLSGDITTVSGLPFTTLNVNNNEVFYCITGQTWDSGAGWRLIWGNINQNSTSISYLLIAFNNATVNATNPITFGTNDGVHLTGTYIAA